MAPPPEEALYHIAVSKPCYHSFTMPASKLREEIRKADKAVGRRDKIDGSSHILCDPCIHRVDKRSCSINPIRKINSITEIPQSIRKKLLEHSRDKHANQQ